MVKKILTYIYIFLFILLIYFFQVFVIDTKSLFGVKPNLILISVIVVSLWYGMYTGTIFGFVIGCITDLIFGSNFGMFSIAYTIVGAIIGILNSNYRKENKMSLVYVTLIATTIFESIQYIEYLLFTHTYNSLSYLLQQIAISGVLNIIIVFVIYNLICKIVEFFEIRLKSERAF